jgi:hypothetical protein
MSFTRGFPCRFASVSKKSLGTTSPRGRYDRGHDVATLACIALTLTLHLRDCLVGNGDIGLTG